ncbi:RsmB/NOP family class I SAM-dependent RNA methyltransferase [Sphingomonas arenae]|uniref:RsmB/NOP family class I SAM-dependent RNA methyltransferase n=1 Tax=Sphingomonas arenae TaxID=2812555 RepID=UPI001966FC2E|nr:RsmB/NOP family class I SAM-dependent RNA methyltransferase [Sphingomonas arenae]
MNPQKPSVPGLGARRAALQLLDAVLRRGQTLDAAARKVVPDDKSLALAIAGETFRRLPHLDALIDSATRQRLPDDSKARMVLRLALAQKLALSMPEHAIVATALPLVDGGPRRLVHGVLGTLLRRGLEADPAPALPPAVEQRWSEAWGEEVVESARQAIVRRPPLDLSFREDTLADRFLDEAGGVRLAPRHVRIHDDRAVADLPGYSYGDWWVQDLAASLPARLMPRAAATALDLCAAPGGKTLQLAAAGHKVTALDQSESRLGRLRENLARTRLSADIVVADALRWTGGPFDAVLLDAPCSATATFRRHPEVLYRASARIIADSAALQRRLLAHAATLVRPGGALVYAVCSLEPEEGERIIDAAPAGLALDPIRADELPAGLRPHERGWLRILPGMLEEAGGLDSFFIARLVRTAA